jgi:crotonobetainyl-CoA:carnitine CoA-transferase CaiB-like acyl-CoA transferase
MVLGDLGAEVIRIEDPGHPDVSRSTPPHFLGGESVYFLSLNRNKKSLALNLKHEDGLAVFHDLVKTADVVFDNYRPGVMEKLGIDYTSLKRIKPDIICCSLSGFGQTGVFSRRPGYDYIMQGISGLMSFSGEPGSPPQKTGMSVVDHVGGLYSVIAILASLVQRARFGTGQYCDVALLDSIVSLFTYVASYYLNTGELPNKVAASGHPSFVPVQNFETSDGYIVVMAITEKFWKATCDAIGQPELALDAKFNSAAERLKHKQELLGLLIPLFRSRSSAHWLERLEQHGVPASPINNLAAGLQHPQLRDRKMVVEIPHPSAGRFRVVGSPIKLGESAPVYMAPPRLGEHTLQILSDLLGYEEKKIAALRTVGAIG